MTNLLRKVFGVPKPSDIPGFQLSRDPEKGWVYSIDKQYINGYRKSRVMPVNPQYDVVKDVELLGHPRVIVYEEMARSPRTEGAGTKGLPTVDELLQEQFYEERVSSKVLGYDWRRKEFGKDSDSISDQISTPVEIHPYASNVFIFPAIKVSYTQGVQVLGQKSDRLTIRGDFSPLPFVNGRLVLFSEPQETNGLAYVGHVRVPVDLRHYFKSPRDMGNFTGELPTSKDVSVEKARMTDLAYDLFNRLFKEKLEQIGQQVEENRKMHVKGVFTSPIKLNRRLSDSGFSIGTDPEGELVVVASYLV